MIDVTGKMKVIAHGSNFGNCRGTTPMGSEGPLHDSAGREVCTKSRTNDQREGIFTQVRATRKRKTLLLPWFIISVLEPKLQERLQ